MKKNTEQKNWLEWSVTVISGILVAFTIGFLIYQIIYEEQTPPDIVVVLGEVQFKDGGYALPIHTYNNGTQTAENVIIQIKMKHPESEEISEITFAYLPRKSSANGWVSFSKEPHPEFLSTRVVGYSIP